jgi:hypothetical protein
MKEKTISYIAYALIIVSCSAFFISLSSFVTVDVGHYFNIVKLVSYGLPLYSTVNFEYPPYVLLLFLVPALGKTFASFKLIFAIQILIFDILTKLFIWRISRRYIEKNTGKKIWVFAPLIFFSIAELFLVMFYFQLFDIVPAFMTLIVLWSLFSGFFFAAGFALIVAIFLKLYPLILLPVSLAIVYKKQKIKPFLLGAGIAILPLIILSFIMPWWKFLVFHSSRGLQVESLYASIIWFIHFFVPSDTAWVNVRLYFEIHGSLADATLLISKIIFAVAVIFSVILSVLKLLKSREISLDTLVRTFTLPILAFIAFNTVFSPQYLIWLLPFAALMIFFSPLDACIIFVAIGLTFFVYPRPDYGSGFNFSGSILLLTRNLLLVVVFLKLAIKDVLEEFY